MTNIEIMQRTKELHEQIEQLRKAERELNKIKYGECKHDIIAITYRASILYSTGDCIFCGTKVDDYSEMKGFAKKGSTLVDVSDSWNKVRDHHKVVSTLQKIYKEMMDDGMEIGDDLFEQAMKARFEAEIQ